MIITDIERQKKNPKRFSVFLDGKFAFGMEDIDIIYYKLKINDKLSDEKYNLIMENSVYARAKDMALKFIARSPKTEAEVRKKLSENEYSEEITDRVIEMFRRYNYINDEVYANAFIRDKFKLKGYGRKRLEAELKNRGINESIIRTALDKMNNSEDFDETGKAYTLIEKKLKGKSFAAVSGDFKERKRLEGFLIRKGYTFDVIKSAFERFEED